MVQEKGWLWGEKKKDPETDSPIWSIDFQQDTKEIRRKRTIFIINDAETIKNWYVTTKKR